MITADYVRTMAGYNRWQNENLYGAAGHAHRCAAQGAARRLLRLDPRHAQPSAVGRPDVDEPVRRHAQAEGAGVPQTRQPSTRAGTSSRRARRPSTRSSSTGPASSTRQWLEGDLTWFSGAAGREVTKPKWLLVTHMFNHQTHHRGQVHCMLTQCGAEAGRHGSAVPALMSSPDARRVSGTRCHTRRTAQPWVPALGKCRSRRQGSIPWPLPRTRLAWCLIAARRGSPHERPRQGQDRPFGLPARLPLDLRARRRAAGRQQDRPRARRQGQQLHGRRHLRQGRALRRAHPSSRPADASAAPQGAEGLRPVRAHLLGRRPRHHGRGHAGGRAALRPGSGVALLLCRHHGPRHARRHQPAAPRQALFGDVRHHLHDARRGPATSPAPASSPAPIRARWPSPTWW